MFNQYVWLNILDIVRYLTICAINIGRNSIMCNFNVLVNAGFLCRGLEVRGTSVSLLLDLAIGPHSPGE